MIEIPYHEFDPEVVELCRRMNSLPGIHTTESCCGHGCGPFHIFFKVDKGEDRGLFLLGRVTDKRYWKFGYKWDIMVNIADVDPEDESRLPLGYLLESRDIGSESYDQAFDLVENIKEHLQHENFLKLYNLDFKEIS